MISSGIEPATFRLVTECLNHLLYATAEEMYELGIKSVCVPVCSKFHISFQILI
jgi:hypothetical protein